MSSLKKICLSFALLLTAFIGQSRSVLAFEWPRYDIEGTIDTQGKVVTAKETVTFTNNTDTATQELYFHIYPNRHFTAQEKNFMMRYAGYFKVNPFPEGFQSHKIDIRSIASGSQRLKFQTDSSDETVLKVTLPGELKPSESIAVTLDFSMEVPHAYGRFGWHENVLALSRWYPILCVFKNDGTWDTHAFYPFHRPFYSESAHYKVAMTIPENQTLIHSGDVLSETKNSVGKKTITIETSHPIREFTMALSPDYKSIEDEYEGVKINSFYLPGDESHAKEALAVAKDVFRFYSARFGTYPYKQFNIAPVFLGYGGEQMSNMIFIDTRVYGLPRFLSRYFDFLISHETGHQWFYNIVGMDGFTEMWLEEGVNSFFNLEYLEDKYGKDATVVELPKYLDWLLPNFTFRQGRDFRYNMVARTKHDQPVQSKLSNFTEPASIFSITYGKGSRIVGMLKERIGQEAFEKVYARIFQEYRFRNLSQDEFIKLCEQESGKDLKWFFDEWLTTAEKYDAAVSAVKGNAVTLENRGKITMPVDVEVQRKDGSKEMIIWDGKAKSETLEVSGGTIKNVSLDPDQRLLDIDRTNNSFPRKLNFVPVPLYLGLYDLPIFLPDDGYNLVLGPEFANNGMGVKTSLQKPYDYNLYAASDYEFGESEQHSRLGFELKNVGHDFRSVGFELFNVADYDNGEDDLAGGKAYIRQELWPASYGLGDINDHVTLYLLRDRSLNQGFSATGAEDSRNTSYLKKDEAIVGTALHLGRSGPYPDPVEGYKVDGILESSGHFMEATQYFYRGSLDWAGYKTVTPRSRIATRLKYGWGFPLDKNLYELGGWDGLRGFDRKTVRGARAGMGSLEYRFPMLERLNWKFFDNVINIESIGGVVFADAGQAWNEVYKDSQIEKDVGVGLRATMNIGSFLEKVILRFDVAQPIAQEDDNDTHFWFGAGQAF